MITRTRAAHTALVLGAGGQDGTLITRMLLNDGGTVHATGRTLDFTKRPAFSTLVGHDRLHNHLLDPEDAGAVRTLVESVRPDQIYCLTGQSSVGRSFALPAQTIRSHLLPLLNLGEAVRAVGLDPHIVYAGSGDVFGETSADAPARENSPLRPASPYGAGKAAGVMAARSLRDDFGLRISIAHLFSHESASRPPQFVFGKVIEAVGAIRAGQGGPLVLGRGDIVRDWGWAPDYAAAMIAMAEQDEPTDLILATGHSVRLDSAVAAIFAAAGLDAGQHVQWDEPAHVRRNEIGCMAADIALARQRIGWTGSIAFPALADRLLAGPDN